jgi:hypothetical protein
MLLELVPPPPPPKSANKDIISNLLVLSLGHYALGMTGSRFYAYTKHSRGGGGGVGAKSKVWWSSHIFLPCPAGFMGDRQKVLNDS